ncbi:TetR/AcrR family transcriptional regulator [Clostridium oryzae]|uniref:Putative HTH-type transcriptional regulator YfiR n=1 Tax=Clostridium oryzae TaxID=1450648 RepID=A0A1V4IWE2_9CLOT|nr:TetR/AcrR family transcriptional regulator [Clostridium oryzae]OPJ64361.1 putative HTH-type transcriptional regulator YfiR [Clostridium oryzae]
MPKVKEGYFEEKKAQILDAAFIIFKRKPLYEMTMLDVINEAGLSKGGIYRYFNDIDAVIIALINRETAQNNYKHKIDEIITNTDTTAGKVENLFIFLGDYLKNSPATLGKIQFELTVLITNHPEKADKYLSNLTEQENGQYLVNVLLNKIREGVNNGEFKPIYPLSDIISYIMSSIDGVVKQAVMKKCYGSNLGNIDETKIFRIISDSVLYLLGKK